MNIEYIIILLIGGLLLILLESFSEILSRKWAFPITAITLIASLFALFTSAPVNHPLLTPFITSDAFARIFAAFFLIIGLITTWLSSAYFQNKEETRGEYAFLLIASITGLTLISSAADFLTLFIGLEIVSISLYVLVAYLKKNALGHEAAIKYFLLGSLSTSIFIFGVALIYGATGTTRFADLHSSDPVLFFAGASLVTLGLFFKAAAVPFHIWAPDVYEGTSSPVTAFLAVASKAGGFAGLARIFLLSVPGFDPKWNFAVECLAIATIIFANVLAMRQTSFRRFFAYSGISHSGFLLIAIASGTPTAIPAMLFYLIVYATATLGAFAVLIAIENDTNDLKLESLTGLFSERPYLAIALSLCLLTLAGFPPFVGFFAKFALFKVAYQAGMIGLLVVGLLMTVFSAYYYFRIVLTMFRGASLPYTVISKSAVAVSMIAFLLLIYFTLFPETIAGQL